MGLRKRILKAKATGKTWTIPTVTGGNINSAGEYCTDAHDHTPRRSLIRMPAERARQLGADQSTFFGQLLAAAFVRGFRRRRRPEPGTADTGQLRRSLGVMS